MPCNIGNYNYLSGLIEAGENYYLLYHNDPKLYCVYKKEIYKYAELKHAYRKIVRDDKNNIYYAISCGKSDIIYVLDDCFCEIDCLMISFPVAYDLIEDIFYDNKRDYLLVVTENHVFHFNRNGDCLGIWMSSPKNVKYKAICTYGNFVFITFKKSDVLYIASYTKDGVYLEKICIGCKYVIFGQKVYLYNNYLSLKILAKNDRKALIGIEVELDDGSDSCSCQLSSSDSSIDVECESQSADWHSTCFVEFQN